MDYFDTVPGILILSQTVVGFISTVLAFVYVQDVWPLYLIRSFVLITFTIFLIGSFLIIITNIVKCKWIIYCHSFDMPFHMMGCVLLCSISYALTDVNEVNYWFCRDPSKSVYEFVPHSYGGVKTTAVLGFSNAFLYFANAVFLNGNRRIAVKRTLRERLYTQSGFRNRHSVSYY